MLKKREIFAFTCSKSLKTAQNFDTTIFPIQIEGTDTIFNIVLNENKNLEVKKGGIAQERTRT
ncbi:MAG TPA: hypothetical protein DCE71_02635, partial [Parachlamydiales bacterium]|nr:hypothetical protein [Parachlamydiales bacterium]